jgi:membrane protease YdiL (CAAX protease family)
MFTHFSDLAKGLIFYAIVFGLVVGVSLSPLQGQSMLLVAMLMPAVATLAMLLLVTRDGYAWAGWASLGLHRPGFKWWPMAIVIPLIVLGVAYGFVWSTGIATYTPPTGMTALDWVSGLAQGMLSNLVVVTLTFSLGEELGWRGYLLPRLAASLGTRRGMAVTGFLHGLFHMPIIFLTPYYHPDGNRWVIVPLFLAAFTIGGLLYGYLRMKTNSVWPASLAHSANNYFWALFGSLTVATSPIAAEYLAGESGILVILGYGAAAAWLLFRPRAQRTTAVAPAAVGLPRGAH